MLHPFLKLGKKKARRDGRNLLMSSILKQRKLMLPTDYSIAGKYPSVRLKMYGNDILGDCVLACRANHTSYFEFIEQKKVIPITDQEVESEYFKETGGDDTGLYILDSLNEWRKDGWSISGKTYKIKAFAEINPRSQNEIRSAIFADLGVEIGIELPISAQAEINAGKPWSQTTGRGSASGSWGGHCVLLVGYDAKYLTCVTWGRLQRLTWNWLKTYCSEAYGVIDALNTAKKKSLIDRREIDHFLYKLAA